jgi:hypothetical protein
MAPIKYPICEPGHAASAPRGRGATGANRFQISDIFVTIAPPVSGYYGNR